MLSKAMIGRLSILGSGCDTGRKEAAERNLA
jgi:hypothetical protein